MKQVIKKLLKFSLFSLYESHRVNQEKKNRDKSQKKIIAGYLESNEVKKLHIGCGSNIYKGWLNTDLKYNKDIAYLDAGKEFPFHANVFNYVYTEHLFEHLNVSQQLNMLKEAHRVLKQGGVMRIATPSLEFLFNLYQNPYEKENDDYVKWAVNHIPNLKKITSDIEDSDFYYCYVINNFFKAWGHQMIHNTSSLEVLALQCGFTKVRRCEVGESKIQDLKSIEKHGSVIPQKMNLIETMVVELIK